MEKPPEVEQCGDQMCDDIEYLQKLLNENGRKVLERLLDNGSEVESFLVKESFKVGFRLGMQLTVAGLEKSKNDMDLWGLVDKNGKVIIPCSYVSAQVFNGKVVLLCDKNSQWSIRNLNGKLIKKLSKEYGTTVKQELSFISLFGILGLSDFGGEV